jgi:hypothetical protein
LGRENRALKGMRVAAGEYLVAPDIGIAAGFERSRVGRF